MRNYIQYVIAFVTSIVIVLLFASCSTQYGIQKRHERKLLKLQNDSIRAANTRINQTTTTIWNDQWNFNYWNWWRRNQLYNSRIIIQPRNKRNYGNNRSINTIRNNRGVHRNNRPVASPPKRKPKVRTPRVPLPQRPTRTKPSTTRYNNGRRGAKTKE